MIYKSDSTVQGCGSLVSSLIWLMVDKSLAMLVPWIMAIACVVLADLLAGLRKSLKLGVHISISTAFRNTMGKLVTYFAFVCAVCFVDVSANGGTDIAKWSCLFICLIEGVSIAGNLLKPYGIDLSLKAVLQYLAGRFGGVSREDFDGMTREERKDVIRKREERKWNNRK